MIACRSCMEGGVVCSAVCCLAVATLACTNLDGFSEAASKTQLCEQCRRARYHSLNVNGLRVRKEDTGLYVGTMCRERSDIADLPHICERGRNLASVACCLHKHTSHLTCCHRLVMLPDLSPIHLCVAPADVCFERLMRGIPIFTVTKITIPLC